jgi:hypothetical protein
MPAVGEGPVQPLEAPPRLAGRTVPPGIPILVWLYPDHRAFRAGAQEGMTLEWFIATHLRECVV